MVKEMSKFVKIRVRVPDWSIPHWWVVAYKILPDLFRQYGELLDIDIDEKQFGKVVGGYINSALEGNELPADIAPTILNLANDLVNGRDMIIRTGDYIAIQKHLRGMK
ncbi:MAG: hypothetical protein ACFFDT_37630 [Candidatus Hodarchaeota archaeon]